jgi:hypothetical protein
MTKIKGIFVLTLILCLGACSKPKIIPDDKLAMIFHDAYLTNAYAASPRIGLLDSLNLYEPLFARYGYTSEDVRFTIGNFAKRKSARLSDVVDEAITMIRTESRFYLSRIAVQDTLRRIAGERFVTIAYTDSLIRVRRIPDTARLRITIPAKSGTYDISYSYLIDSLDENNIRPSRFYLLDSAGRESGIKTHRLRRRERERVSQTIAADSIHRLLVIDLNGYPEDMTTPAIRIDSLVVKYFIPDRIALDSMARGWFDYRMLDSLSKIYETHFVPPFADTIGVTSR